MTEVQGADLLAAVAQLNGAVRFLTNQGAVVLLGVGVLVFLVGFLVGAKVVK